MSSDLILALWIMIIALGTVGLEIGSKLARIADAIDDLRRSLPLGKMTR